MFWKRKAPATPPAPTTVTVADIRGDGSYDFEVVGEASYQDHLAALAGDHGTDSADVKVKALLFPQPDNPRDRNAIVVLIGDRIVGYLSRQDAVEYAQEMAAIGRAGMGAQVRAKIVGGFTKKDGSKAHYGVKLDLQLPFDH